MKNLFIATLLVLSLASTVFAAGGSLPADKNFNPVQGFAPNGAHSAALTLYSTWHDMRDFLAGSLTAPADCKVRLSTTSGLKTGFIQEPVYGGQWNTIIVDKVTPFWNTSGCTTGVIRKAK